MPANNYTLKKALAEVWANCEPEVSQSKLIEDFSAKYGVEYEDLENAAEDLFRLNCIYYTGKSPYPKRSALSDSEIWSVIKGSAS